jgi:hypothetical protein
MILQGKNNMAFPNMADAFRDWTISTKFAYIEKEVSDFEVKETQLVYNLQGLFQPATPQAIALKPEGQRTWKWWSLITEYKEKCCRKLKLDDIIVDEAGKQYRVMAIYDWHIAGFYACDLTEAYIGQSD